ncbi:MAG TPA: hypothetical protein VF577_05210 [Allosphingosinicella sp.]
MTVGEAWALLGIAPTDERRDVKRAYARVLKTIDADADPEAFKTLRDAYETALAWGTNVPEWEMEESAWEEADPLSEIDFDGTGFATDFGFRAWNWDRRWQPASPFEIDGRAGELARDLNAQLFGPDVPDPANVARTGDALLDETETAPVDDAAAVEAWLVDAIASSSPRSDPLIEPALRHFGWGRIETEWRHESAVGGVLARREDLRFVAGCRRAISPYHRAFAELNGPPRSRVGLFELGLAGDVRDLLRIVDEQHPTMVADFDPDSLAWWRDYFVGSHLPVHFWLWLASIPCITTLLAAIAWREARPDELPPALALFAASVVTVLLAMLAWSRVASRLRLRAQERSWNDDRQVDANARFYAGAALVLPVVASLVQFGAVTAIAYTMVALAIAGALMIHAPPPLYEDEAEATRRRLLAGVTGIASITTLIGLPRGEAMHLLAPFAALVVAAARGGSPAAALIAQHNRGFELGAMAAAALVCAAPLAALFVYAPNLPPTPLLALVPVAFAAQHFATAASRTVIPWLEWTLRLLALLFYFSAPDLMYGGAGLPALTAAVALYALAYGLARTGFAARDALGVPPRLL